MKIRKFIIMFFMLCAIVVMPGTAFSQFDADWGKSDDTGKKGYNQLAQWLVDNNYYDDLHEAKTYAKFGYVGHDYSDRHRDPFYWNLSAPVTAQIVQEMAGFADQNTFGYYTGGGHFKSLTEVFGGTENGPETFMVNQPFGFYLGTPEGNYWYTDRGENDLQDGKLRQQGGSPQGLIYELVPNTEWLIAWEDLDASMKSTDRDYNDMYVKLTVAAEPMSAGLYALGGSVLAALGWRKKRGGR